jgi:pimeloyl-ACP methyl ester carboxylesterase
MKTTNFITLPDGRKLAYAEFGKLAGHPVIYFHGGISSRLEPLLLGEEIIDRFGLRLIVPDRPGIGQSDVRSNHSLANYPQDIVVLADSLGLDKFSILGISGGSGYILTCAAKIPDRLLSAVAISDAWDMNSLQDSPIFSRWSYSFFKRFPFLFKIVIKLSLRPF